MQWPAILVRMTKGKAGSMQPGHKYTSRKGTPGHYQYEYPDDPSGDLFGGAATKAAPLQSTVDSVPVSAIHRDPTQPREHFDEAKLKELAASIKKLGLVQAISIRPHPDGNDEYMIIAGERRWRALQIAGIETAKVEIYTTTDEEKIAAIQVAENVGRAEMNPMEEARAFQKMIDTGSDPEKIAAAVGASKTKVERRLSFLTLIPSLQEMVKHGSLPIARAEIIAAGGLRDQFQQNIVKKLNMGSVSREALRGMVGRYQTAQTQTTMFGEEENAINQRITKKRRKSLEGDLMKLLDEFGAVLERISDDVKVIPALAKEKGKLAVTARKVSMINDEIKKLDRELQFAVQYFDTKGGSIDSYLNAAGVKPRKKKRRKAQKAIMIPTMIKRVAVAA